MNFKETLDQTSTVMNSVEYTVNKLKASYVELNKWLDNENYLTPHQITNAISDYINRQINDNTFLFENGTTIYVDNRHYLTISISSIEFSIEIDRLAHQGGDRWDLNSLVMPIESWGKVTKVLNEFIKIINKMTDELK